MKARADELLRAVLSLPIEDRAAIVAELLASLEESPDDPALSWFRPAAVEHPPRINGASPHVEDDDR